MPPSEEEFFLFYEAKQHGPFSAAQVRGLYLDGAIQDDTPACQAGMAEWQPLRAVLPELAQAAAPQVAQTQNAPAQSQSVISPPNGGLPRKTVVALVSLCLAFALAGVAGVVWGLRQRRQSVLAAPVAPAAIPSATGGTERKGVSGSVFLETKSKAEKGDVEAQFNLGICYYSGQGVAKDYTEAVKWFRKAAEQGDTLAQWTLGNCCANGQGVAKDDIEAVKWYRRAAEQGDALAQLSLGSCYELGLGVTEKMVEAVKWFRKAAAQGGELAQLILGNCYAGGQGVAEDYTEAVKWYRKAADQNYAPAQKRLGDCYANGEGVAKDYAEAYAWYNLAAKPVELAANSRDSLEKKMSPQQVAAGQKRTKELLAQIEGKLVAK